ncbi:hypothetical protein C8Q72DRAFT_611925 [Fomitopsis betulina]|nr:hypothetical protein C8Q72DRAFT_611925 [Fomitopsis betulina]
MVVLLRDSVLYFGGALATILSNFIIWKSESQALFFALVPVNIAINSVLGCRMMLHITRAGHSGDVTADTEEPQARSSSVTEHSLSSSCAPLNHGPASQSDHARSSSLTDSADGLGPVAYGPVIEISRDVSILRDWDIYAKRNDLTL